MPITDHYKEGAGAISASKKNWLGAGLAITPVVLRLLGRNFELSQLVEPAVTLHCFGNQMARNWGKTGKSSLSATGWSSMCASRPSFQPRLKPMKKEILKKKKFGEEILSLVRKSLDCYVTL